MSRTLFRAALALSLALPALVHAQGKDFVSIAQAADGSPTVAFHFAPGSRLRFTGDAKWQESVRKVGWKFDPQCFRLEANTIELASAPRCADETIRLDWDERERDRMYPALVRFRNGGVLVYTGYLQVASIDNKTVAPMTLKAPPGGIVAFRDRKSDSELVLDSSVFAQDGGSWFYLGPDRFREEAVARVLVDDGVPAALQSVMLELAPRLVEVYSNRLGVSYPRRPTFFLTWNARERAGRSFQADVVPGGVIRFGVSGAGWDDAPPDANASYVSTVAHELAHLWNMDVYRHPEWAASWLAEGNSELLATAALLDLDRIDAAEAAKRVSNATAECALLASGRSWPAIFERQAGRAPYVCGLALQFAIVAAARHADPTLDAFFFWRAIWSDHPDYYEAVFEQYANAHGDAAFAAALRELLTGTKPVADTLERLYSLGGLHTSPRHVIPASFMPIIGAKVMSTVMAADCHGAYSHDRRQDHFYVHFPEAMKCDTFRSGMKVVSVGGYDLFKHAVDAAQAVDRACDHGAAIPVRMLDDKEIDVACPHDYASKISVKILAFPPDEVARTLDGNHVRDHLRAQAPNATHSSTH